MQKFIEIKGARVHNLKNIDIKIPRNQLVVVSGLSGSGKSTLAFDTVFAEGQRRYVESLSAYARQFLGRIHKPEVDSISGIPPAIAIEQKVNTRNPRSTVGTTTEIYDYLKLLFARIGRTYSPISGNEVTIDSIGDVCNSIMSLPTGERLLVMSPITIGKDRGLIEYLSLAIDSGLSRIVQINHQTQQHPEAEVIDIKEFLQDFDQRYQAQLDYYLLIDRLVASDDDESYGRMADSVQTAFQQGQDRCSLYLYDYLTNESERVPKKVDFSNSFDIDGIHFEQPSEHLFSFNNPLGACPTCEGYGKTIGIDEDLVVPNKSLSIYDNAIVCWRGDSMSTYRDALVYAASKFNFPIHRPYYELTPEERLLLWTGNAHFEGLNSFFQMLEAGKYKIQYRVMLSRYMGKTTCPTCGGARLRKEAGYVKINGYNISQLVALPVDQLGAFFDQVVLTDYEATIAGRTLIEIKTRINCLLELGLSYLNLNRLSNSLSGGESQRINLSVSLGSSLVGSLYILDEPSIGLHPRDSQRLISVLRQLRDIGNTVLVVEHEEEIIRAADQLIDIGPLSGSGGGELVFQGTIAEALDPSNASNRSLTLQYLRSEKSIPTPTIRRKLNQFVMIKGAREHNLKGIDVKIPLHGIVAVTGVSGSGKSTLIRGILYPALMRLLDSGSLRSGSHDSLEGDVKQLMAVEMVDQNPIGKSSRSNPVTYIKVYDDIRKLYASLPQSKQNGYAASHFSFNTDGGRCEECQGDGSIKVEMQFMADVVLECETCKGQRFKEDILDVKFKDHNINDILGLTVDDAITFFGAQKDSTCIKIAKRLKVLQDVGLGYIQLGQPSSTLSGGESQRVKLAFFLLKEDNTHHTLFIFDEPTTGLHFHDINKLMEAFNALVNKGHSIIVVEHNMDVIKCADWVIDLGPEGGEKGGELIFEGTPEELAKCESSYTGQYLKTNS